MSNTPALYPVGSVYEGPTGIAKAFITMGGALVVKDGDLLVTTTQAEAYAAAKVREALEEAIDKVAMYGGPVDLEAAIRALIPQEPA